MPGLIHWHAPLALLTPGLWALLGVLALGLLLPSGRGRVVLSWTVAALATVLALLALRAAWRSGPPLDLLLDGWVQSGWLQVGLAFGASLAMAVSGSAHSRLTRIGGTWLLVLWALPLGACAAWVEGKADAQARPWFAAGLPAALVLALWQPLLAQILVAAVIAAVLPRWRLAAAASGLAAILGLVGSGAST